MAPPFGLARRPFRLTPDPAAFCPTPTHAAAVARLTRALRAGTVAVLAGDPGTGKSLLGIHFLDALPADTPRAMVLAARQMKPAELLQAILFDLAKPYQGLTEHELRLGVTAELLAAAEARRRFALLIDDAQNLSPDAVEELRLLGNVTSPDGPPLFALLTGLPALRTLLAGNPSLAQQVAERVTLTSLPPGEARAYLCELARRAGGRGDGLFDDEALDRVVELGCGVPRQLNRLAGLALTLAEADAADAVSLEAVLAAAEQLELVAPEPPAELRLHRPDPTPPDDAEQLPHPNQVPRPPTASRTAKRKTA